MSKLLKRLVALNTDLIKNLKAFEEEFKEQVRKTLIGVNKNRKSKITSAAGMGVLAFYKDGEPISLDDYIKPIRELEVLWMYVVDNFNYYMAFSLKDNECM